MTGGLKAISSPVSQTASSIPLMAAKNDSSNDSVISWRTSRGRLAPIDKRTAISLPRALARDSSMLATLTQLMISSRPTTTMRTAKNAVAPERMDPGIAPYPLVCSG